MNCCYVVKFHQNPHIVRGIKQNEIVGGVLLGLQVVSLSAITFFTYSNICKLLRILLRYLFLIFVFYLPRKLISISLQSHLLQKNKTLLIGPCYCSYSVEKIVENSN